ncbi:30S ribosomal protein S19e [Candidatus Woesearchaeota archaeon]|nr:30S ribosomal protein S19e [Candidatus Woesearchaeota archaeon]
MEKIYRVDPTGLIEAVAAELKKIEHIKAPVWATFCKTGTHKARPPVRDDWWFVRAASVLRRIGIKGPIGVAKLRTLYGGKKDRGYAPEKFYCASGNILRKILQQLEKSGLVKKASVGVHKGRVITKDGEKMLEKTAESIFKPKPKKEPVIASPEKAGDSPKAESKGAPKQTDGAKHADMKKESKPAEHHKESKPSVPHTDAKPVEHPKDVKAPENQKDSPTEALQGEHKKKAEAPSQGQA